MTKLVLALAAVLITTTATATVTRADDAAKRAEAQKKVDEAKIKACEGVKTTICKIADDAGAAVSESSGSTFLACTYQFADRSASW